MVNYNFIPKRTCLNCSHWDVVKLCELGRSYQKFCICYDHEGFELQVLKKKVP